jgi:hypothetical protein
MLPIGHSISCRRCLFQFDGDIVCMRCATGYGVEIPAEPTAGQRARLMKRYRLEMTRVNGKIHCKANKTNEPTDVFVTMDCRTFESHGFSKEVLGFPVEALSCPHCSEAALKFYLDDPDTCPSCGAVALHKYVIWGSFV